MDDSIKTLKTVTESNKELSLGTNVDEPLLQSNEYSELHSCIQEYQQRHYMHQLQTELLRKRSKRLDHECKLLLNSNHHLSIHN